MAVLLVDEFHAHAEPWAFHPPVLARTFQTATGKTVQRSVGYAILRAEGFETIDEVVFAEPGDVSLLGVRTP